MIEDKLELLQHHITCELGFDEFCAFKCKAYSSNCYCHNKDCPKAEFLRIAIVKTR